MPINSVHFFISKMQFKTFCWHTNGFTVRSSTLVTAASISALMSLRWAPRDGITSETWNEMQYKIPITVTRRCLFLLTAAVALAGFSLIALAMMMVSMIMMMKSVYTHDAAALVIMNRKTTKPNKQFVFMSSPAERRRSKPPPEPLWYHQTSVCHLQ